MNLIVPLLGAIQKEHSGPEANEFLANDFLQRLLESRRRPASVHDTPAQAIDAARKALSGVRVEPGAQVVVVAGNDGKFYRSENFSPLASQDRVDRDIKSMIETIGGGRILATVSKAPDGSSTVTPYRR